MSVNESPISAPAFNPVKRHLCFKNHKLSACTRFKSKSHADKIAFLRQNRLCDNCFPRVTWRVFVGIRRSVPAKDAKKNTIYNCIRVASCPKNLRADLLPSNL